MSKAIELVAMELGQVTWESTVLTPDLTGPPQAAHGDGCVLGFLSTLEIPSGSPHCRKRKFHVAPSTTCRN